MKDKKIFETMSYIIAADKASRLMNEMQLALQYFQEYEIKPDEEMKNVFKELLKTFGDWLDERKTEKGSS